MNEKWREKTIFQKVMDIIAGIALLVYIIFESLERSGKVKSADLITCIAICIVCICEAFSYWNKKRIFSYIAILNPIINNSFSICTIEVANHLSSTTNN